MDNNKASPEAFKVDKQIDIFLAELCFTGQQNKNQTAQVLKTPVFI